MYNVPHFKTGDHAEVMAFMHAHPFITLCGVNEHNQPVATHIPVLLEERNGKLYLLAHIMRKQEHTRAFETNPDVLAIFSGAHTYVSASWYENKKVASTWNYQAVHARGIFKFLDDAGLYTVLKKLTANFEQDTDSPSLVEKMDEQYMQNNMKAIVAFEIELTDIQHVFKLSQNRDEKSYNNIVETLGTKDAAAQSIAATMHHRKSTIFPT